MASATDVVPQRCTNECGFFGNALFNGFCSRCYAEEEKKSKQQEPHRVSVEIEKESVIIEPILPVTPILDDLSKTIEKSSNRKKARCPGCSKHMGILQYECACGGHFCAGCRYPNEHKCTVDYKAVGRKLLTKANPQVIADRVHNRQ